MILTTERQKLGKERQLSDVYKSFSKILPRMQTEQ